MPNVNASHCGVGQERVGQAKAVRIRGNGKVEEGFCEAKGCGSRSIHVDEIDVGRVVGVGQEDRVG